MAVPTSTTHAAVGAGIDRRVQASSPQRLRRDLHRLRRLLPGAQQPGAGDPRHPARVPAAHEGRARPGADRSVALVRRLEVPDGGGLGPQQSEILSPAGAAAVLRHHADHRPGQGGVQLAGDPDRAADAQRVGAGDGLAPLRQDDGPLVRHARARTGGLGVERLTQRRRRTGGQLRPPRGRALQRLGGEVLLQRADRRRPGDPGVRA